MLLRVRAHPDLSPPLQAPQVRSLPLQALPPNPPTHSGKYPMLWSCWPRLTLDASSKAMSTPQNRLRVCAPPCLRLLGIGKSIARLSPLPGQQLGSEPPQQQSPWLEAGRLPGLMEGRAHWPSAPESLRLSWDCGARGPPHLVSSHPRGALLSPGGGLPSSPGSRHRPA